MEIRKAILSDVKDIMKVIKSAQELLKSEEIDQWQDNFPNQNTIIADISNWESYVFINNSKIVGFVAIALEEDEGYNRVYDGEWINKDGPYITIHRTAFSKEVRGLGLSTLMFELAEKIATREQVKSIRIDTHEDNNRMKYIIKKNKYIYCGYILLARSNAKRIIFEKVIN